jgi:hypothetical protein
VSSRSRIRSRPFSLASRPFSEAQQAEERSAPLFVIRGMSGPIPASSSAPPGNPFSQSRTRTRSPSPSRRRNSTGTRSRPSR